MIQTVHDLKEVGKNEIKKYLDSKWIFDYCIQPSIYGEYDKVTKDIKLLYHYKKCISKASRPGELCKWEHKNIIAHFTLDTVTETYTPIIYIK